MPVNLFVNNLFIIGYFIIFNEFYTQYHNTTLSKYIILLHHVSISAEHPYTSIRDDTIKFLKHNKLIKLLDKVNTIDALHHAHIIYYIYYNALSTVDQKDTPVRRKWQQ